MKIRPFKKVVICCLLLAFAGSDLWAQGEVVFHGLDTLPDFRHEWAWRSGRLLRRYAVDAARDSAFLAEHHRQAQNRLTMPDEYRLAHITRTLSPNATGREIARATALMDSLYAALQAGADFGSLARQYSQDTASSAQGGQLPWEPLTAQLQEWIDVIQALPACTPSRPFLSPWGIHIVMWTERREGQPYTEARHRLEEWADRHRSAPIAFHTDLEELCRMYPAAEKEVRALHQQMIEERLHSSKPDEATSPTLSKKELKQLEKERKKAEKERKKAEKEQKKLAKKKKA